MKMKHSILSILLAGFTGTTVMTLFLYAIHARKIANGDMVRAIGSLILRKEDLALPVGLAAHYLVGLFFAFVYSFAIGVAPGVSGMVAAFFGGFIGCVHGVVVAIGLTYLVADHHPLPRFRDVGMRVVVVHFLAHVFYGFSVGAVLGYF
jgi:hypothetical protein